MSRLRNLLIVLAAVLMPLSLSSQPRSEKTDSIVQLLSAQSMSLVEQYGIRYRKVIGPARFLHNNTYLICDTALWNVDFDRIEAMGNVKILQDRTVLTSDKLTYLINEDLAQFRGSIVQLEDKEHNTLRTRYLDYNTKDSVAVFRNGGSMKDKDGQIIESKTGTYDSKIKLFTFTEEVNMYTDSIFVRTSKLTYNSEKSMATFGYHTGAWKDDNFLSSNQGWYNRQKELFLFHKKVHAMNPDKEAWADSMYFYRETKNLDMRGKVQLVDTTRGVTGLAGRITYVDSLSRIEMLKKPAVYFFMEDENHRPDTAVVSADRFIYQTKMRFEIPESEASASKTRLGNLSQDAVGAYRKKAAEEAAKAAEEAAAALYPNRERPGGKTFPAMNQAKNEEEDPEPTLEDLTGGPPYVPPADTAAAKAPLDTVAKTALPDSAAAPALLDTTATAVPLDTAAAPVPLDTVAAVTPLDTAAAAVSADTLTVQGLDAEAAEGAASAEEPKDSTKLGFLTAMRNVKLFRKDIQMVSDSLAYNDLDSLIRLYGDPMVWNDANRQYSADSLFGVFKNGRMEKADLISNAFIVIQEEENCFDQIRGAEMLAYFDSTGVLTRFDALGTASAVFYLKEDSTFATVNKSEAKMLYAVFKDGDIDRIYYFEEAKNDAYPLAQMRKDDRLLKGFKWSPERRPMSRLDVSRRGIVPSERAEYSQRSRPGFKFTDMYFPGYMDGVYKAISDRKKKMPPVELPEEREAAQRRADSLAVAGVLPGDTTQVDIPVRDTSFREIPDSLAAAVKDSLAGPVPDSVSVQKGSADSLSVSSGKPAAVDTVLDVKALKQAQRAAEKALREEKRNLKTEQREAKWARLDSLDAAKAKIKADKKAAKLREKKRKALLDAYRQAEKEQARIDKYVARYLKRKDVLLEKARKAAERKDAKAVERAERKTAKIQEDLERHMKKEEEQQAPLPETGGK